MARVKGALATRKRRKKVLKLAKGYWGSKSRHFKMAKQAVMKSGNYAYIGRKQKKRDFRRLWISRINAARALLENTELSAREIAEKALDIAGDICIYTNHFHTIEELSYKA